jgi:hypothetical protein
MYNPDPVSIGVIQGTGGMIEVLAGYKPFPSMIFTGSIPDRGIIAEKKGTDRIIVLEAGDGEFSSTTARFDWHYSAGTEVNIVLQQILLQMGLGLGPGSPVLPPRVFTSDTTFFGLASDALNQICSDAGASWSIQDGNVVILLDDSQPTIETAILLTSDSGLIESPSVTDDGVNLKSLLNPGIRPGRILSVLSFASQGFFKARKVVHTGDTEGNAWYTEVEATPLD